MFWPIPGLISCAGVTGSVGITCDARAPQREEATRTTAGSVSCASYINCPLCARTWSRHDGGPSTRWGGQRRGVFGFFCPFSLVLCSDTPTWLPEEGLISFEAFLALKFINCIVSHDCHVISVKLSHSWLVKDLAAWHDAQCVAG